MAKVNFSTHFFFHTCNAYTVGTIDLELSVYTFRWPWLEVTMSAEVLKKENLCTSFSCTLFNRSLWNIMVLKQIRLNIMIIILLWSIGCVKQFEHWHVFRHLWSSFVQTWYDERYYWILHVHLGHKVTKKLELVDHSNVKIHRVTQMFAMVDYVREMTSKKSCK